MTLPIQINELTETEQQFLYNVEVLGIPQKRAAELAGVDDFKAVLVSPAGRLAREKLREALRTKMAITREDIVAGYQKAIQQADLIGEPMTQIAGWREIAKILGLEAPKEININVNGERGLFRRQIAQLSDDRLIELLEADDVIDGDFYALGNDGQ